MKSALVVVAATLHGSNVAFGQTYKLPWWHPTLDNITDEMIVAPPGHPLLDDDTDFQGFIDESTGRNHRGLFDGDEGYIYAPWGLPNDHPGLDRFFEPFETPYDEFPIVYFDHPDIYEAYRQAKAVPEGHPAVMDLLAALLPTNHPNIDDLFQAPQQLPEWHIDISGILTKEQLPKGYPAVTVYFEHPDVDLNYIKGNPQPRGHPSIERMLEEYLPPNHPPDLDGMIQDPRNYPLPYGHPSLNAFILRMEPLDGTSHTGFMDDSTGETEVTGDEEIEVDTEATELSEDKGQSSPPTASATLETAMSVEVLPTELPFSVYDGHPALMQGRFYQHHHHPKIHHLWVPYQPLDYDHPNIDDLMEEGFELPSWHPSIAQMIEPRVLALSPGSLLCYALSALFVVAVVLRNSKHWFNTNRTSKKGQSKKLGGDSRSESSRSISSSDDFDAKVGDNVFDSRKDKTYLLYNVADVASVSSGKNNVPLCPLSHPQDGVEVGTKSLTMFANIDDRHHNAIEVSQKQHESDVEKVLPIIIAYQEKRNTILRSARTKIFGKRVFGTDSSNGHFIFCLLYIMVNAAAVLLSPYDYNVGYGSLAAGNIVFLVVSAIKNSVFTWFLGMAFDHVIIYHRFIGRVTVMASFIHGCFYFNHLMEFLADRVYKTGFIALMFGIFIAISSLNWIRRKYFNVFYWSHLAFVGFIVCVYLHAPGAQPFVLAAVGSYAVDKLLHMVWTQLPRKTVHIEPAGISGKTTFVRFNKTPLNRLLGRNKVGQWVVINFPELSLTEWHPFSVASGPSQPFIDLYIRALGNHTKKIANYSQKCASENRQALIRVDGPYGNLPFNYRRYGSLVLIGGGIGITPILSIIKDIYEKGEVIHPKKTSHCISNVHLIWILPFEADAALFKEQLLSYHEISMQDPALPQLDVSIHVTREESTCDDAAGPIIYSRPNFQLVIDDYKKKAALVGSSSILVFACGPGSMVNQVWDASMKNINKKLRVDFHHESFAI